MSSKISVGCITRTLICIVSSSGITLITLVTVATLLILVLLNRKRSSKQRELLRRLPPGPVTLPVIGNLHQVIWNKPTVFRWIHRLLEEMGTYILCLLIGAVHVIAMTCPEIAREVLCKNDAVFASRPTTFASCKFSFGYKGSILTPHGEKWKKIKRVLMSEIIAPFRLQQLRHLWEEESDHLVRYIYNNSTVVNVRHVARHFCGNMVRRLAFGKRYFGEPPASSAGGPRCEEVAHVDALFTLLDYLYNFCVSDYFPSLVGLDLDGHEKVIVKDIMRTLNRFHDPIIENRIRQQSTLQERRHGEKRDFLDVLVSLVDMQGRPLLSTDEIRAQILEIMFAVVDNPSQAVEWALAEMMNKPDIMQKAINKLNAVVGKDRLVQESDIPQLNYLKSCIREAFRLHPYNPLLLPHVAMADTTIASYMIPKGSQVILSRAGLGRNPKVWIEPLEFCPERHLDDGDVVLSEPGLRFISFSTGRRGCPGVLLGTSVTMMLFARILQGFTWMEPPGVGKITLQERKTHYGRAHLCHVLNSLPCAGCRVHGNVFLYRA